MNVALCANALHSKVRDSVAKPEGMEIWTKVNLDGLADIESRLQRGAEPTREELRRGGVPPEVAWFSKWQQLRRAGVSSDVIERTGQKLFRTWGLDPAQGTQLTNFEIPK